MNARLLPKFLRDRRAGIGVMVALSMLPLLVGVGLAVDTGRAFAARTRLGYALDAAALAVGSSQGSQAEMEALAARYVAANYPLDALGQVGPVSVQVQGQVVVVAAAVTLDTVFMPLIGQDHLSIRASSEVTRENRGLELALVLDNTGSMTSNNNIGALRDAAQELVDILFGDETEHPKLFVALVPYSAAVNPGDEAPGLVPAADAANYAPGDDLGWKGCVRERPGAAAMDDSSVGLGGQWARYHWLPALDNAYDPAVPSSVRAAHSYGNGSTGPNLGCPTPITPLTNRKTTVTSAISAMRAWSRGGTLSSIGMAWGRRVLSPEPPFTQGLAWGTPEWDKAVVLMTDGENQMYELTGNATPNKPDPASASDYTAFGRIDEAVLGTTSKSTARDMVNSQLADVCDAMKSQGIIVYTIVFTSGINQATRDIYSNCASDAGKYFYAPSQAELRDAFQTIGRELSRLRVSR